MSFLDGKHKSQGHHIAVVGMFDGCHRGHRYLIQRLKYEADRLGLIPLVLGFERHPLEILAPERAPMLLSHNSQRVDILTNEGIKDVRFMHFSTVDFALSAEEFLKKLHNDYGVRALVMGFNNHIGSDRRSGADLADKFPIILAEEFDGCRASSSEIRRAVSTADFATADKILGHHFTVRGIVDSGRKLGRTIGFPTANIRPLENRQLLPPDGVYAVDTKLPDGTTHRGMANIGTRPTVGGHHRTFEVNIFDFNGDLYGRIIDVAFLGKLRDEKTFSSLDALAVQLAKDKKAAENFAAQNE